MRIDVITIFPEYLAPLELSLIGKARREGLLDIRAWDLRSFATDRHRTVDDTPYGGGAGMVMIAGTWGAALDAVLAQAHDQAQARATSEAAADAPSQSGTAGADGPSPSAPRLIIPGPGGVPFNQALARELAQEDHLVFACGRYEGIDERVYDYAREAFDGRVDVISLGDYVLNGGEVAVLAMCEAIVRLRPGVIGNAQSLVEESHEDALLEYPVYTKPAHWRGRQVPPVLLSGDHGAIAAWRHEQRLLRTSARRPDLLAPGSVPEAVGGGQIQLATNADAGELATVRLAAHAHRGPTLPDSPAPECTLIARAGGRLIGALSWHVHGRLRVLDELVVVPDLRGRGVARALLRAADRMPGAAEQPSDQPAASREPSNCSSGGWSLPAGSDSAQVSACDRLLRPVGYRRWRGDPRPGAAPQWRAVRR